MKINSTKPALLALFAATVPLLCGCPAADTETGESPVPAASTVDAMASSPVVEASPDVVGPPMPPPGPKAAGDFDKKPFKSSGKIVKMPNGLQYDDMTAGKGAEATAGKTCVMHYTGTLADGTKFDSSRDKGEPYPFPLGGGQVIRGWDEGVAGMKVGGRRKLTIPADLGYGAGGQGPIPGGATLLFDVELMDVR